MNKFFNKFVNNFLKDIFNKNLKTNSVNFMKHKLFWLLVPIVSLVLLVSIFVFYFCIGKFDVNVMMERTKTIIEIPLKTDVDSKNLEKIQNTVTDLLKFNCVAQKSVDYDKHINSVLNKDGSNILKLTTFKSSNLTEEQKNLLFNKLNSDFSDVVDLSNVTEGINPYVVKNIDFNMQFWIQLLIAMSILFVVFIAFFTTKFKKLGIISTCLTATIDLTLSLSITLFSTVLLTQRIDLVFIIALMIYFTNNVISLFKKMHEELKNNNTNEPFKLANLAVNKNISNILFVTIVTGLTSVCGLVANIIFNNPVLFYLTISMFIGILVNSILSIFFSPKLWVFLRSINLSNKNKKVSAKLNSVPI